VLRFGIEILELKVLFQLFEQQFNVPAFLVEEGNLEVGNFKVVTNEFIVVSLFISIGYFSQTKGFFHLVFIVF